MAHNRKDSSKPTTTISFDPTVLEKLDDYWYTHRKGNRSKGANELIMLGLKYVELLEKKREKNRVSSLA